MAAEMINEVLQAEAAAAQNEEDARKKAEDLIEYAEKKAEELTEKLLDEARTRADIIIEDAHEQADAKMEEAKNLAKLRKKSVIKETVKKYDVAIEKIVSTLTE